MNNAVIIATALSVALFFFFIMHLRNRSERRRLESAVNARTVELHVAYLELRTAAQKAEAANRAKTSFLARMSHDMRTPLNAILGLSAMMLETGRLDEENETNLNTIKGAGTTLLSLVSDILDISKIEAGNLELITAPYETPSLINDAVTQSLFHIGDKPVSFALEIDAGLPMQLCGDELRIKQILNNLLSNAFKYTNRGEVVMSVGYGRDESCVWLTAAVRDTGVGIRQEDIPTLFDDYVQIETRTTCRAGGTGLGLSISKRLAELMGGGISVESEFGKGSTFTMRLRQEFVTDTPVSAETIESLKCFKYTEHKEQHITNSPGLDLFDARVLVVDDNETNLQIARGFMKSYNMQVDCLTSGLEAIEAMRDNITRYNAIFMDHMMPGMDGVEATRRIREIGTEYAKNVPVIAFTANAIVGNKEIFLQSGFQDFLSKPLEMAQLDAVVRQWVWGGGVENGKWKVESGETAIFNPKLLSINAKLLSLNAQTGSIDLDKGIRRFGGDGEAYADVLRTYARNTRLLLESIGDVTEGSLTDYAAIVHGIKGSSRGICADKTADLAEALEIAAKAGEYGYVLERNAAFIETERLLLTDIERILEQIRDDGLKPLKDRPDEEALERLRRACVSHDMDAADTAVKELEKFEYVSGGELVAWLRESAEQMNYSGIVNRLDAEV